jgi:hypothetical protein
LLESIISIFLGCLFGITFGQILIDIFSLPKIFPDLKNYSKLGFYLSSLGIYHYMEYIYKSEYHHKNLSWHDFLLDYSVDYVVAILLSFAEYFTRNYFIN